jgi:hypothetical protein
MQIAAGSWILDVTQAASPSRSQSGRRVLASRSGGEAETSSRHDRPSLDRPARGRLVDLVV